MTGEASLCQHKQVGDAMQASQFESAKIKPDGYIRKPRLRLKREIGIRQCDSLPLLAPAIAKTGYDRQTRDFRNAMSRQLRRVDSRPVDGRMTYFLERQQVRRVLRTVHNHAGAPHKLA